MATGIVWDLAELYHGDEDPRIEQDLGMAKQKSRRFVADYKGKLNEKNLDAQTLLSAIEAYEAIYERAMKPYLFAYLYRSSNNQDYMGNRLLQRVREQRNEISQLLTFFELELMELPQDFLMKLATQDHLLNYRHFLLHLIQASPFALREPEENIIKSKNLSGRTGLLSFYDELMGSLSFPVEIEGRYRSLTGNQVLALLHSPDRSLREQAFQSFLEGLGRHGRFFKHILNNLILDYHLENLQRGHPSTVHRMNLSNEVDENTIETMMGIVEDHYPLARRYFRLKAHLLGLEKLKITDIFAPLFKEKIQVTFSKAKQFLLEAMGKLHPLFHSIVDDFFQKKWIDAEIRRGKTNGAFCKCLSPSQHPYISMNYTGTLSDLVTLVHELGHGIHYCLSAGQTYLNFNPPPILAETASTFSEIILIQDLMRKREFQNCRETFMTLQMEGIFTTVFRQNILTRFEQALHHRRQDHLLDEEEICRMWWDENYRLFGEDVEMIPAYRWGWTYIPHFVHRPFYCYSYIFGNLLSLVLFKRHSERGGDFLEKIISLFRAGSSQSPLDIFKGMGLDPGQKSFWEQAFLYMEGVVDSLELFEKALNERKL